MLSEAEIWAHANRVIARYPDSAWDHIYARIMALREAGDAAGERSWWAVAERVQQILVPTRITVLQ